MSGSSPSAKNQPADDSNPAKSPHNGIRPKVSENIPPLPIPLLDLKRKYRLIQAELQRRWNESLDSMRLLNGVHLAAFEQEFAQYCGVRHAVGVASGTDAIFLSLRALAVGPGDEVILPAHAPAPVIEPE